MGNFVSIFLEHGLNKKEVEAAYLLISEGLGNDEIAVRISRSLPTVKAYFTNIYRKFDVKGDREFLSLLLRKTG